MIELSRVALAEWLPRNSESRALSVALRLIKKQYPQIEWVQTYADATQCGDGAIYRATGWVLVQIRPNASMWRMPDGKVRCSLIFSPSFGSSVGGEKKRYGAHGDEPAISFLHRIGAQKLPGFQLRYLYFLDPTAKDRLTVPILPYSAISEAGASMYKGKKRVSSVDSDTAPDQGAEGGANPTETLLESQNGDT
jgi:hypothetical protein